MVEKRTKTARTVPRPPVLKVALIFPGARWVCRTMRELIGWIARQTYSGKPLVEVPDFVAENLATFTGWPDVEACTIWPLPMYMATWLVGL